MAGYIGARSGTLALAKAGKVQDLTATDTTPEVTIINSTHEDSDGGREGKVIFKGQQSGGEESTLAEIQGSHDGSSDDEKGDLIFKTNDGSDGTSPTEAMRIDAEQNLGLGTNAPAHRLDIVESADAFGARITNNSDGSQGLQVRTSDNDTGQYILDLQTSSSATGTDYASKMVVEKGGNIGIGVTDPDATLDISGGTNKLGILRVVQRASGAAAYGLDVGLDSSTGDPVFSRIENDTVSEAFRIDRGTGDVLFFGATSIGGVDGSNNTAGIGIGANYKFFSSRDSTTSRGHSIFYNPNGGVGSITTNGSATAFNTSSDYRLKENVADITDGITRVKQLKPSRFNFIADADTTVDGFLAHEAATVVPEAITGTKDEVDDNGDAVMQQIDQAKLVPLLTAALQEAIAKIETLETKVAALEAE